MAEVLFNIAGAVLNNLGALAVQEIGLFWGLSDELGKLRNSVSSSRAVLLDAEKRSRTDEAVKLWLRDLKDVAYDADDLLDAISTDVLRRQLESGNMVTKEVRRFFSSSNGLAYGLIMAHKVKAIREKFDEVAENRKKFHLNQNVVEPAFEMNHDRETHSCPPNLVIGREDDKTKLVSLLLADHGGENVVFIPIVGLGGMGKTTLAQMIYNDETVKFDLKVWVCVSDVFDVKSIVEKMIECIDKKRPDGNLGMEALKSQLHERVKGKKYLFVLDDVWNEDREKWVRLIDLIVCGVPGSRILVTTRSKIVGEVTGASQTYELGGLSEKESWDLFQNVAFKQGHFPNVEFEELGKEIATKCCGLPLAIRTIGSLLYTKKKESEWRHFKDQEFLKLDPKVDILKTLELSYNHLPSNLKHCFAYCSLFPKDHIFDVSRLVSYWKAQGYVGSNTEGTSSQDNGLNCLKYLVQRSFLQQERENEDGEIVKCKMHDFMHDLAMSVAGEEVQLLTYENLSGTTVSGRTRHMSLFDSFHEAKGSHEVKVAPLLSGKKTRTLIVKSTYKVRGQEWLMLDKLRYLRVLSLSRCGLSELPSFIDKLKHLRQLDLSRNTSIKMLPDSITRLCNLQELYLDRCKSLKKLPRDMEKLVNLIHLGLDGCDISEGMPLGIGKLTSLEVLSAFYLSHPSRRRATGGLDELEKLNKLKGELRLRNLQRVKKGARECEVANLKDKPHLRSLTLEWSGYAFEVEDRSNEEKSLQALQPHENLRELNLLYYRGERFPEWASSLKNLVKIEFFRCGNCKYLPSLDGLPSLEHLEVERLLGLEYMIDNSGNTKRADTSYFFPSLEKLIVRECPELKGWWSTEEPPPPLHFQVPRLSRLEIINCPNLKGWMPQFPSLKHLDLTGVSAGLLEETLKQANPPSTSTSLSPPLPSLHIGEIIDLGDMNLSCYKGVRFPEWASSLKNLVKIQIIHCWNCKYLPSLDGLPSLKHLEVEGLLGLEYMIDNSGNTKRADTSYFFPSLETLSILFCPELKGWWSTEMPPPPPLHFQVPRLSELEIYHCPNLKGWMPQFSSLKDLDLIGVSGGLLEETLKQANPPSTSTSLSPPLQSLSISKIIDLGDMNLFVENNTELIQRLRRLSINVTKMKSLPERFQYLTALEELEIGSCQELESMPIWMVNLTSLKRLQIRGCPLLGNRCGSNRGEDWPFISHIPNIYVEGTEIQLNGSYQL